MDSEFHSSESRALRIKNQEGKKGEGTRDVNLQGAPISLDGPGKNIKHFKTIF